MIPKNGLFTERQELIAQAGVARGKHIHSGGTAATGPQEVSSLVADVRHLQHHVGCEAALDREIPLLVVRGLQSRRLRALPDSGRLPTADPANCRADTQTGRERIAEERVGVDAIDCIHPRRGGLECCAGELRGSRLR